MREECMDTGADYRILVAEEALSRIENRLKSWSLPYALNKPKAVEEARRLRSSLMGIKHSYLPLEMLLESEQLRTLEEASRELSRLLLPQRGAKATSEAHRLAVAELKYALSVLMNLRKRLLLGEENRPEFAVDVVGVEVAVVEKHPSAGNLFITKAGTEEYSFTIVTNIKTVKRGEVRAAAVLPPVAFFGVVSEAMYLSDPLPREHKGKRVPSDLIFLKDLVNSVDSIVRGLKH